MIIDGIKVIILNDVENKTHVRVFLKMTSVKGTNREQNYNTTQNKWQKIIAKHYFKTENNLKIHSINHKIHVFVWCWKKNI